MGNRKRGQLSNKSQGISLRVIIIAALALIVLVVLIAIFSGKIQLFGQDYDKSTSDAKSKVCWSQPGHCGDDVGDCTSGEYISDVGKWLDCGSDQGCCRTS